MIDQEAPHGRDASWLRIGTSIRFAVPASPLGARRFYFQQRYESGSTNVASNVVSDDVEVRPAFSVAHIVPVIAGEFTGTHNRLLCPTGQILTGVRIRQATWIRAIGPICAGSNRAMVGDLQAGTLETHACTRVGEVPLIESAPTSLRFDQIQGFRKNGGVRCLTNVMGGNTFDPLDAVAVAGMGGMDSACRAPPDYLPPHSAPIGLDVYVFRDLFGNVGISGIGVICVRPY
jgi:hypothetical protein